MPFLSSSIEVDNNDLLTEVNGIKLLSMVEENIVSSCTVDDESNSPHVITDHLSDGVTLAITDSTTPEVKDFAVVLCPWTVSMHVSVGLTQAYPTIICLLQCVYKGQVKFEEKKDTK